VLRARGASLMRLPRADDLALIEEREQRSITASMPGHWALTLRACEPGPSFLRRCRYSTDIFQRLGATSSGMQPCSNPLARVLPTWGISGGPTASFVYPTSGINLCPPKSDEGAQIFLAHPSWPHVDFLTRISAHESHLCLWRSRESSFACSWKVLHARFE